MLPLKKVAFTGVLMGLAVSDAVADCTASIQTPPEGYSLRTKEDTGFTDLLYNPKTSSLYINLYDAHHEKVFGLYDWDNNSVEILGQDGSNKFATGRYINSQGNILGYLKPAHYKWIGFLDADYVVQFPKGKAQNLMRPFIIDHCDEFADGNGTVTLRGNWVHPLLANNFQTLSWHRYYEVGGFMTYGADGVYEYHIGNLDEDTQYEKGPLHKIRFRGMPTNYEVLYDSEYQTISRTGVLKRNSNVYKPEFENHYFSGWVGVAGNDNEGSPFLYINGTDGSIYKVANTDDFFEQDKGKLVYRAQNKSQTRTSENIACSYRSAYHFAVWFSQCTASELKENWIASNKSIYGLTEFFQNLGLGGEFQDIDSLVISAIDDQEVGPVIYGRGKRGEEGVLFRISCSLGW